MPASQIETLVTDAIRAHLNHQKREASDVEDVRILLASVERVVICKANLRIELRNPADDEHAALEIPWTPRRGKPKREVLQPASGAQGDERPMRVETRATIIRAMALGRLWLQELVTGKVKDTEEIASREDRSKRSIHMMISLAFLAPDIVEAAVNGQIPRRIGISRLTDLPPDWRKQREMLGLR